jgi:hypothetical protein
MDILTRIHSPSELRHVIAYLNAKARNLVESPINWFVIAHLAGELAKRNTMTGNEVVTAIREGYTLHLHKAKRR